MRHLDLIYFDVTSGHRSAAQSIARAIARRDPTIDARLVNLVDLLAVDPKLQRLAHGGIDLFNWCVRHELPLFQRQQIGFFQVVQRSLPASAAESVARFWRGRRTDLVASLIPICNGFLQRSLHRAKPGCPYVVIPVDITEGKDRYWFDPDDDVHYLNASEPLATQAARVGIPAARAVSVSGMPIDPAFYDPPAMDRAAALTRWGLDPAHRTVLVSFGGYGSVQIERCADALAAVGPALNVVFLCGRHDAARERLARKRTPYQKVALGFAPEAPVLAYAVADVVVGKPGTMTITESMVSGRPLVALRSESLAVVQRGNEDWIRAAGVGEVVTLDGVADAVRRLLARDDLAATLARHRHRGVDDITDQLLRLGALRAGVATEAAC